MSTCILCPKPLWDEITSVLGGRQFITTSDGDSDGDDQVQSVLAKMETVELVGAPA